VLGRTATVAGLACCVGLLTLNMLTGATAEQRTSQPDPRTPARTPAVPAAQPARSPRNANYTITARLDNATNELYHNHLNYLKDLAPEMGRNFAVVYNTKF